MTFSWKWPTILQFEVAEFTTDGIPDVVLDGVAVLPYNSSAAFDRIRQQKDSLAVVFIQAVQASNPRLGMGPWLQELARVCKECDVLLAFDETVTGFRMAWGGGHVYCEPTHGLLETLTYYAAGSF